MAVSRARYEMIVFSTLCSDQLDLNRTSPTRASGMKRVLEFVEKGGRISREREFISAKNSSIEHVITKELREKGHYVHTEIGSSGYKIDIGITDKHSHERFIACSSPALWFRKNLKQRGCYHVFNRYFANTMLRETMVETAVVFDCNVFIICR